MNVLGYVPGATMMKSELVRATRLLELSFDQAHTERQVIRMAEKFAESGEKTLVVTSDEEIALIREIQARIPTCRVLLISAKRFIKLPYFLSSSPNIDGFFISQNMQCGADFFLNFLKQQINTTPQNMQHYMGNSAKKLQLEIMSLEDKEALLQHATSFYLWSLGDPNDQNHLEKARLLTESLDELFTFIFCHSSKTTLSMPNVSSDLSAPMQIELAFDGTLVGTRLFHPSRFFKRRTVTEALSSETLLFKSLETQQRIIFNLKESESNEVICFCRLASRFRDSQHLPTSIEVSCW